MKQKQFIARLNFPQLEVPGRVYVHPVGFAEAYENKLTNLQNYFLEISQHHKYLFAGCNYFLATIWGDVKNKERVADLFMFSCVKNWPGNPDVLPYEIREGELIREKGLAPEDETFTCSDTLIMLGKEEEYRRATKSLEEYMVRYPDLGELEASLTHILYSETFTNYSATYM